VGLRAVSLDGEGDGLGKSTLREMKLLSQLRHPHVVRLLEIVKDKNADLAPNYSNPSGQQCFLIFIVIMCGFIMHRFC